MELCKQFLLLGIATLLLQPCFCSQFYSFTAKDIHGQDVSMEKYRGKVVLIVNVASECGFTDVNYRELVALHNKYSKEGLAILAFPCNQFGKQEPKRNYGIYRFAVDYYGVQFDMFSKIKTVGDGSHPLYNFLVESTGFPPIWNFNKYLVNRAGVVVKYFNHSFNPSSFESIILRHLRPGIHDGFESTSINDEL